MIEQVRRLGSDLIGQLINVVGIDTKSETFGRLMFQVVQTLAPFQLASMVVYSAAGGARCIHHNFVEQEHRDGLDRYINYTYVLNPVYAAFQQQNLAELEGVVRVTDLNDEHPVAQAAAVDGLIKSESEEIGYLTPGWPTGMTEILVLTRLEDGSLCEMGLLKPSHEGRFTEQDIAFLISEKPILDALLNRHWLGVRTTTTSENSHVAKAFESFAQDRLTTREQEIAQMILRGHSSLSIGLNLGIALPTVKAHRRNIYAKLSIASQSELLALFLASVDRFRTHS
ncbi:LuxR C-terminal-related transcriptional regulator [Pseudomonas sp. TR47]|uniref:helix-turn-helix transcriptional regulator n=1 Tax=Pseudomonas sp. TR47 TaxID=3342639 RepID=UPI00376F9CA3